MPNILSHCLCADKAIISSGSEFLMKIVNKHPGVFALGAQGPDPYFFYHFLPIIKSDNDSLIHKLGSKLHVSEIRNTFKCMLEQLKENKNESAIAYVAGFLSHHALDTIAHPYVYYRTEGIRKKNKHYHAIFEGQIDLGLLQDLGLKITDYRLDKKTKVKKNELEVIATINQKIIKKIFDIDISLKDFKKIFTDMHLAEAFLFDRDGKKYKLIEKLEELFKLDGLGTSMVIPTVYDDKIDAYNFRKDKWHHPVTNQLFQKDYRELFDEGIEESSKRFRLLDQFVNEKISMEELLTFVGEKTYNTGLETNEEMIYFENN